MAHAQWVQNRPLATLTPPISRFPAQGAESWPVDLGNLDDLRMNGAQGSVYISLNTSEGWVKWGFGLDSDKYEKRDLTISYIEQPGALDSSGHYDGTAPSAFQPSPASGIISAGITQLPAHSASTICRRINENQWRQDPGDQGVLVGVNGLTLDTLVHEMGSTGVLLNGNIRKEIEACLRDLTYLRATRNRPIRGMTTWPAGRGRRLDTMARIQPLFCIGAEWKCNLSNCRPQSQFPPLKYRRRWIRIG